MTRREMERQLNILEAQLMDVHSKSERVVCAEYNVDNRQEAIDILNAELNALYKRLDEVVSEESDECSIGWVDQAFKSLADFERMRI